MASTRFANRVANKKKRQVVRTNMRLPKKVVVKKFANHVKKTTYKTVKKKKVGRGYGKKRKRY